MSEKLAIWRECCSYYYKSKNEKFKIPKKGTEAYIAIKRDFDCRTGDSMKCLGCKKVRTKCKC